MGKGREACVGVGRIVMAPGDLDLRDHVFDVVHNQGPDRPLCVVFAMSLAHEAERTRAGAAPSSLAPEALWSHAHARGLTTRRGTSVSAIALALADEGQPLLVDWPFNPALGWGTEGAPATAGAPPWMCGDVDEFYLSLDGVEPELEAALAAGRVVLVVIEVTDDFYYAPPSGRIAADLGAVSRGRHAVSVVGAATVSGERLFLVQNSWGTGWAAGGYGWLGHDYLSAFGGEAAAVVGLR
jgi:hypothetical protein